jgi:hypothetical protein
MEGLALAFDDNGDEKLDSSDQRWEDFRVWQDANGDGASESGEVLTLEEAGIASVGVESDGQAETRADGDISVFGRCEFTRADGSTATAGDVGFDVEEGGASQAQHSTPGEASNNGPDNDQLSAMLAQRVVQSQAMVREAPLAEVGPEEGGVAAAANDSDNLEVATVGG